MKYNVSHPDGCIVAFCTLMSIVCFLSVHEAVAQTDPTVTLSVPAKTTFAEGKGNTTVTVSAQLSIMRAVDTVIDLTLGGTAQSTDYTVVLLPDLTIKAGQTTGTADLMLSPVDDVFFEKEETAHIGGTASGVNVTGIDVPLTDNEEAPTLNVSATTGQFTTGKITIGSKEGKKVDDLQLTVNVIGGASFEADETVSIDLDFSGIPASIRIDPDADLDFGTNAPPWSLTIPAGRLSADLDIKFTVIDDEIKEPNEYVNLRANMTVAETMITGRQTASNFLYIQQSDQPPIFSVFCSPPRIYVDGTVTCRPVSRGGDITTNYSLTMTWNNGTLVSPASQVFEIKAGANHSDLQKLQVVFSFKPEAVGATQEFSLTASPSAEITQPPGIVIYPAADPNYSITDLSFVPQILTRTSLTRGYKPFIFRMPGNTRPIEPDGTTKSMEVILDSGVVSIPCAKHPSTSAIQCTYTIGAGDFDFDGQIEVPAGAVKFTRWRDVKDPTVTGSVASPLPAMKQVYKLPGLLIYGGSQAIDLSVTPQTVQEGTGEQALTIIAQNRVGTVLSTDLVIPLSLTDISTDSGDYSVRGPLSVTIPAGKTEGRTTVLFTPTDDLRKEGAVETVRIEGSKGAMLTPFVRWTDLQILDAAGIRLTASPTSISEDGGAQMVTVTAEWASAGDSVLPQALDIALSWGGSAGTGDYGRSGGTTVTIPANGRSGSTTVTLTPTDDRLLEGDESIVIRGTAPGRTVTETEVTLTDDETLPAVSIAVDPATIQEGGGAQTVTVSATLDTDVAMASGATTLTLALEGTATGGTDYTSSWSPTDRVITIPANATAGSNTVSLVLTPTDDQVAEGDETIVVKGTAVAGSRSLVVQVATVTLADDDERGINLLPSTVTVAEGGEGDYEVWLGTRPSDDVTITLSSRDSTIATISPSELVFKPGEWNTKKTVTVSGVEDAYNNVDDRRTTTIDHTAGGGGYGDVETKALSVIVTDNDRKNIGGIGGITRPGVTITESGDGTTVSEDGTTTTDTYTIVLDSEPTHDVTVTVSAAAGVQVNPSEGTAGSIQTLTFTDSNWADAQTITVTGVDDEIDNAGDARTVTVTHTASSSDNDYDEITINAVTVTVNDDDTAGVTITESGDDTTVSEDGTTTTDTYTIVLDSEPTHDVTVTVSAAAGVEVNPSGGTAGSSQTLTFTDSTWADAQTITVTGVDDEIDNAGDARTVTVTHTASSSDNDYDEITINAVTVTVNDDDTAGVTITESGDGTTVSEDGTTTTDTYTVVLDSEPTHDVTVTVSAAAGVEVNQSEGTAGSSQTLTFTDSTWADAQTITVTGVDDEIDNAGDARTVTVTHTASSSDNDYDEITINAVTVTVNDDDTAGVTITESGDGTTVSEDGTTTTDTYTVVLDSEPTHDVVITVMSGDGVQVNPSGGTAGSSQTLTFTALNWDEVQTITVTGVDDDIDDGASRTVTISHTATSDDDDYDEITIDAVTVTVNDDDTAGVTVSESARTVAENGGTATYTVKLNTKPLSDVVITVTSGDGTAVKVDGPDDQATYSNTERLTFTAMNWAAEQTVMLQGQNDAVDTPGAGRTTSITHAVTTPDTGGRYTTALAIDPVAVTVTDDDPTTVTLGRTGIGGIAENGGTVDFTVTLGRPLKAGETVTVPLSVSGAMTQHYTLGLKSGAGLNTGVTRNTANPHSAALPAVVFSGHASETVQTATLTLTAENNADRDTRTVAIGYGTSTRVPTSNLSGGITPTGSVSVVLIDDDAMITVASASAAEGSAVRFTVTLPDPAPTGGVTIGYSTSNGRGNDADEAWQVAIAGTDYTAAPNNAMLTIPANGTGGTIEIATTDDSTYEGDHYFTVTLDSTTHFNLSATAGTAVGTITDVADTPTFDWSASAVTVAEDDGTVTLTVRRSGASAVGSTVNWATVNGTAVGGSDFTAVSSTALLFGTDDMAKTVSVGVTDDSTDEVAESFEVALTAGAHAALGTVTRQIVTITDNDPTVVTLSVPDTSAEEGRSTETAKIRLTLGRSLKVGESLVVPLGFAGGTVGTDFALACPSPLPGGVSCQTLGTAPQVTFTGSATSAPAVTLTVSALDDADAVDETVTVSIPAASSGEAPILTENGLAGGATGTRNGNGRITLTDDDMVGVTITESGDGTTVSEDGSTTTDTYTVVLDSEPTHDVTVTVNAAAGVTVDGPDALTAGTATETLTFTALNWADAQRITVTGVADSSDEDSGETVGITHTAVSSDPVYHNATILGVTVTVIDDDPTTVVLSGGGTVAEDGSDRAEITVTLGRNLIAGETVSAPLTVTGTGIAAGDYTLALKGGAGVNTGVTLNTANPHSAAMPAVVFSGHASETVQVATLTVTAAVDTVDESPSETLTVAFASVTSNLDRASGTGTAGTTASGTASVTITEDPPVAAGVTVTQTGDGTTVSEDGSTTTDSYTIVLDSEPTHDVVITVMSGDGVQINPSGGTAGSSQTLTFTDSTWADAQTITVTGVDDEIDNAGDARTVTVTHTASSSDNDYDGITIDAVTVTVSDDDGPPSITLSIDTDGETEGDQATLSEGAGETTVTVTATLSGSTRFASDRTVTVQVGQADDSATGSGTDYEAVADVALLIEAGEASGRGTFKLTPVDDARDETDETISVAGTLADIVITAATLTLVDNDGRGVTVTPTALELDAIDDSATPEMKENEGQYSVVLESEPMAAVVINLSMPDNGRFTVDRSSLTFLPADWSESQSVTVTAIDDTMAPGTEPYQAEITHTLVVGESDYVADLAVAGVMVTVTAAQVGRQRDGPDVAASFTTGSAQVVEDVGLYRAAIDFDPVPESTVRLHYTVGGTATAAGGGTELPGEDEDYRIESDDRMTVSPGLPGCGDDGTMHCLSGTLTVAAGTDRAVIPIQVHDDRRDEPDETVILTLDNVVEDGTDRIVTHTLTIVDNDVPLVTITPGESPVEEGAMVSFILSVDPVPYRDLAVPLALTEHGTYLEQDVDRSPVVVMPAEGDTATWQAATRDDGVAEDDGSVTATVQPGEGYEVGEPGSATVWVTDDERPRSAALAGWLVRFGRSVAEGAIEGISTRWSDARVSGLTGAFAGVGLTGEVDREIIGDGVWTDRTDGGLADREDREDWEDRGLTVRELLMDSDFAWTGAADEQGGTVGLWGRMAASAFEGTGVGYIVDGEVTTGLIGTDVTRGDWLGGLALGLSEGEGSYALDGGETGDIEASLGSLMPYGQKQLAPGRTAWGIAGVGQGNLTLVPVADPISRTNIGWRMMAGGLTETLIPAPGGGGFALRAQSEGLWMQTDSAMVSGLAATRSDITRLRLGLEGEWSRVLETGALFTPTLEVGLRHDAGDAETGWGVEWGSGLSWSDPPRGLALTLEGSGLVAHEDGAFRRWGYGASLAYDPRPRSERGLSLMIGQAVGEARSGGLDALFTSGPLTGEAATTAPMERQWTAEAAYGLSLHDGRFTGSPHVSLTIGETDRETTVGWRWTPAADHTDLAVGVRATRTDREDSPPDHTIVLEAALRW